MAALRAPFQAHASHGQRHVAPRRSVTVSALPQGGGSGEAALLSRRQLQGAALAVLLAVHPSAAQAVGFKKELKKKTIPLEDYKELSAEPRLRYYDVTPGNGGATAEGRRVVVHFTCKYRGLSVVSTRTARTLGGNRTVAEPFEFTVGQPVTGAAARKLSEAGGGLYTGSGGPRPPAALSTAVIGMRVGGVRSVLVPADLGYGSQGEQEIPPNCDRFELQVELLSVA